MIAYRITIFFHACIEILSHHRYAHSEFFFFTHPFNYFNDVLLHHLMS